MLNRFILILILFVTISSPVFASQAFNTIVKAVNDRDKAVVEGMLMANSDRSLISERDGKGRTLLHFAASQGDKDLLAIIIGYDPDINALDNDGRTPIFYAVNKAFEKNTKLLITSGANVNIMSRTRFSPLMIAAQKGKPKIAKLLISADADVNAQSASGATPLLYAAARGNRDFINTLLRNGADLRARDKLGNTAMHYAAKNNRRKVIKELLPIINKRNNAGKTPLDVAVEGGQKTRDFAAELLKNGGKTGR